ncbi:MAG: SUMF1/EgtB/PvdO family nonheme iron enzyme [Pseudomonadota bacterium]
MTEAQDPVHLGAGELRSARGGSFLCHHSYCSRYRLGLRTGNAVNTTCSNLGFRVVKAKI